MNDVQTQPTPAVTRHAPGTFCWWEVATPDLEQAKAFYTALFGWTAEEEPMGDGEVYVMFMLDGLYTGAAYRITDDLAAQGVPPHWGSYIATDDADATADKAKALGGTVVAGPFDVDENGRLAVITDPTGATVSVWQGKTHPGAGIVNAAGAVCWNELATRDATRAAGFYADLFGYELGEMPSPSGPYTILKDGEAMKGGILQMTDEWPAHLPPHWMTYVQVDDVDASAAKAEALGATLRVPPTDIPSVGRFAVVQDPTGPVFSIIKFTEEG